MPIRVQFEATAEAGFGAVQLFGRVAHVEGGCDIVYFDKKAKARLARADARAAREAARLFRTYAILGPDGTVVTVGHRYRRINRP